jgi:hypothetical protein
MSTTPDALRLASAARALATAAGTDFATSSRASEAWKLIDEDESARASLPALVRAFRQRRAIIDANKRLSLIGRREELTGFAKSQLGNVATAAHRIAQLEAELAADRATAVPLPKADASETLIDLALAAHIRAAEPIPSRLMQSSERVRLALARVPPELSGIVPSVQAQVHGSLMSPARAVQFAVESEALGAAREVTQAAISEIAAHAEWTPAELVQHFGASWRLPGITDSLATRLAQSDEQ